MKAVSHSASPRALLYVLLILICSAALVLSALRGNVRAFLPAFTPDSIPGNTLHAQTQNTPPGFRTDSAAQAFASGEPDKSGMTYTGLISQWQEPTEEAEAKPIQPISGFRAFIRENRTVIVIFLSVVGIALTVADTLYVIKTRREH